MPLEAGDKLWIAEAPPGIPHSGAIVIFDLSKYGLDPKIVVDQYLKMGWDVTLAVVTK